MSEQAQARRVMLEIWLRVGKSIIQLSTYVFNSSKNCKAIEKS